MTLQEMKQLVLKLSNAEKKELSSYIGEILVDESLTEQHSDEIYISERDKFRQLLGDVLVKFSEPPEELPIDEQTLLGILDDIFRGQPPLSDELIAEREDRI
ncbi:MAG: hypothetical protein SFZ02_13065 [bacterium]|nr:hypothetical protein [bacterium]